MSPKRKHNMSEANSQATESPEENKPPIRIFFVCKGLDMYQGRIDKYLAPRAERLGATVIPTFQCPKRPKRQRRIWGPPKDPPPPPVLPTHLVVQENCDPDRVAEHLLFKDKPQFEKYLCDNDIQCAVPEWITRARHDRPLSPTLDRHQRWWKVTYSRKRTSSNSCSQMGGKENSQSQQHFSQSQSQSSPKKQKNYESDDEDEDEDDTQPKRYPNNIMIAEQLQILGKLHQKCPLNQQDLWKSYSLDKAAGRIKNLDFEVTLGKESQSKLAQVWGVGTSTQGKINEILRTGTCSRIKEFQTDPERVAFGNLMAIWGVGRSKARQLIDLGFRSIRDVRDRMDNEEDAGLFDRNQRIGIACYEDFKERFSRPEVEAIGTIIEQAILRQFPTDRKKLEITIMGSYRRGKETCGDVDVLITHSDYKERVPPQVLGEVVEDLLERGHMAFHLTYISGMKIRNRKEQHPGGFNEIDGKRYKADKLTGCTSYMGVFHSPTVPGKRRRVDIKFYPHRERAFAWLYFTGNGFFNRSMRLYATRRKGNLQMNDKGLFTRDERDKKRVMEANTEKEVFDFLGLEYKEPHERDCFDALVVDEKVDEKEEQSLFYREEGNHKWID